MKRTRGFYVTLLATAGLACAVAVLGSAASQSEATFATEVGPLPRSEMVRIYGGGENGCTVDHKECGELPQDPGCIDTPIDLPDDSTGTMKTWAGTDFDVPKGTNNPTSTLAPKEVSTGVCFTMWDITPAGFYSTKKCHQYSGDCVPDGGGCEELNATKKYDSKESDGYCTDP